MSGAILSTLSVAPCPRIYKLLLHMKLLLRERLSGAILSALSVALCSPIYKLLHTKPLSENGKELVPFLRVCVFFMLL